jgi:hypothetical protein
MEHRDGTIELQLHCCVTRNWEIYLAQFFWFASGMLMLLVLGNRGHRARQPRARGNET